MRLSLTPYAATPRSVTSQLSVNGVLECFVLEDNPPAVPQGTFEIKLQPSQRFGRLMPFLQNVPGHEGIEIHPGNTPADTRGCLLVGLTAGPDCVLESVAAFNALFPKLEATNPITIEITRQVLPAPVEPVPQAIPPVAQPVVERSVPMADPVPTAPASPGKLTLQNHAPVTSGLVAASLTSILIALAKAKYGLDLSGQEINVAVVVGALVGYLTKGEVQ